ncbi:MAG TPA: hypothetical protein VG126_15665 [Thermoleophilaceae bacterium]|nr:hypothetical protein [Thermoleophilaceae bacterium]
MSRVLIALIMAVAVLAAPAVAHAQSAGDEQYVDPFQGGNGGGGGGGGGGQEQPAEQPAAPPEQPAAPAPAEPAAPAPGGNGTASSAPSAEATQPTSPTLPRTGGPVVLLAALGYALLLAGIAIRRTA